MSFKVNPKDCRHPNAYYQPPENDFEVDSSECPDCGAKAFPAGNWDGEQD